MRPPTILSLLEAAPDRRRVLRRVVVLRLELFRRRGGIDLGSTKLARSRVEKLTKGFRGPEKRGMYV